MSTDKFTYEHRYTKYTHEQFKTLLMSIYDKHFWAVYTWATTKYTYEQYCSDNFEKHTWAILTDDSRRYTWALCTLAGLHLSSVHIHMSTYVSVLMCSTRFLRCDDWRHSYLCVIHTKYPLKIHEDSENNRLIW